MLRVDTTDNNQVLITKVVGPSIVLSALIVSAFSLSYYGLLVFLMGGIRMANAQLALYGPWMIILLTGFTFQMFLFFYQQRYGKFFSTACDHTGKQMVASSGTTGVAMLACCAHHVVDIMPFVGLGAVGVFFGRFQFQFIELGIVSNVLGSLFMLSGIQKHRLYPDSLAVFFSKIDFKQMLIVFAYIGAGYLIFSFLWSLSK
jgi:hypothetical protein